MAFQSNSILIVDDEKSILFSLKAALTKEGYTVRTSESPQDALKLVEPGAFQVIISDFNMPEMTGVQLIERVRSLERIDPPKFIVMSAGKNADIALRGGADHFFSKLSPLEELVTAITELTS